MPIPKENLGSILKFKTLLKGTRIILLFQLPESHDAYYSTKPMKIINSLIRSRHENGLVNYLRSKEYAAKVHASVR
jgi:insulysin